MRMDPKKKTLKMKKNEANIVYISFLDYREITAPIPSITLRIEIPSPNRIIQVAYVFQFQLKSYRIFYCIFRWQVEVMFLLQMQAPKMVNNFWFYFFKSV